MRERFDVVRQTVGYLLFRPLDGILIVCVAPLTVLAWAISFPYWRARGTPLRHLLGFTAWNTDAFLQRVVLRPFFPSPRRWVRLADVHDLPGRRRLPFLG